uniref:Uncharacterized protein n=1 Tax=Picea glauca TaxID=3330 RepID=A0A101M4T8_PICGL|nr:hypothetical protein ABT39_MTgene743 [Picea glauca]
MLRNILSTVMFVKGLESLFYSLNYLLLTLTFSLTLTFREPILFPQ